MKIKTVKNGTTHFLTPLCSRSLFLLIWISVVAETSMKNMEIQHYGSECLESIQNQNGHFGIEVVWINDGSDGNEKSQKSKIYMYHILMNVRAS